MRKLAVLGMLFSVSIFTVHAQIDQAIPIPELLFGPSIELTMHRDSVQFFPGQKTYTLAYNQYAYLGPTLMLQSGDDVTITTHNTIEDTTTVHWHGMHVAAENDGGPHSPILSGESAVVHFSPIVDKASTYWYHPHFHGKTAQQVIQGASGFIYLQDDEESALALPRTYGVDDFPIAVKCLQFDNNNQPMALGMQDSTLLVNGVRANYGYSAYLNVPAQMVRLRLLNASGERTFNFGFSSNHSFQVIGSDGGLLSAPVTLTRVRMAPGERYEILVDLSSMQGQSLELMSYASELPVGVQGGPTMPMPPGSPPMDSPINGIDFNVLRLDVQEATVNAVLTAPTVLATVTPYSIADVNENRSITMSAQSMMSMDGPFYLNGQLYDMERIDYTIPIDNIEIWTVTNQTMVAHPFHIHDVQFYLLDRDGNPVPVIERGRKDVVMIESMETIRFIAKFDTYSDTMMPYVYHCHILMHEDAGMMGQFLVVPQGFIDHTSEMSNNVDVTLSPNPTSNTLRISCQNTNAISDVKIFSNSGQVVFSSAQLTHPEIDVSKLSKGAYTIGFRIGEKMYNRRFIKIETNE